jgi:hypothetical protein
MKKTYSGKIFGYETMSGHGQCPVYLERWTLANLFGCAVYLHHFLGDDWATDPHDHPRRFVSIGLWGWYYEDVYIRSMDLKGKPESKWFTTTKYKAPWIRTFPAEHLHRVRAAECGNTWTLVIVLPKSRGWGFVQDGIWIPFKEYVFGGKARKNC